MKDNFNRNNCNKSRLFFSSAEMTKKPLWQTGAVCSGSKLFASLLNSSVMVGNYLQQTNSADDFSRRHFQMHFFSWRFRVKSYVGPIITFNS